MPLCSLTPQVNVFHKLGGHIIFGIDRFIRVKYIKKLLNFWLIILDFITTTWFFLKLEFVVNIMVIDLVKNMAILRNRRLLFSIFRKVLIMSTSLMYLAVGGIPTFRNVVRDHHILICLSILSILLFDKILRLLEFSYIVPIIKNIIEETKPWEVAIMILLDIPLFFMDSSVEVVILMWVIEEIAAIFLRSILFMDITRVAITDIQEMAITDHLIVFIFSSTMGEFLIIPEIPSFSISLAKIIDPMVEASTWALGSQMCRKNAGILANIMSIMNAVKVKSHLFICLRYMISSVKEGKFFVSEITKIKKGMEPDMLINTMKMAADTFSLSLLMENTMIIIGIIVLSNIRKNTILSEELNVRMHKLMIMIIITRRETFVDLFDELKFDNLKFIAITIDNVVRIDLILSVSMKDVITDSSFEFSKVLKINKVSMEKLM